jgi:predicted transcriptional regulator
MSEVWVKCQVCGKGFDNYPALLAHVYEHTREKLNDEDLRFAQKLREFDEPLTLDEIAERLGMDRAEVAKRMSRLVKADIMKVFIRRNDKGELVAKYIIL